MEKDSSKEHKKRGTRRYIHGGSTENKTIDIARTKSILERRKRFKDRMEKERRIRGEKRKRIARIAPEDKSWHSRNELRILERQERDALNNDNYTDPQIEEWFKKFNESHTTIGALEYKHPIVKKKVGGKLDLFQSLLHGKPKEVNDILERAISFVPWDELIHYDGDVSSGGKKRRLEIRKKAYVSVRKAYNDLLANEEKQTVHLKIAVIFTLFRISSPAQGPLSLGQKRILGIYGPRFQIRKQVCDGTFLETDYFRPSTQAIDAFFESDEFETARREFNLRCHEDPIQFEDVVQASVTNHSHFVLRLQQMLRDGGLQGFYNRLIAKQTQT